MQVGVILPTWELPPERAAISYYVRGVAEIGYSHMIAYDHVLGVDPDSHPGWSGSFTIEHPFHEPVALLAFVAGLTDLELVTGVIILPQRQTALVAKQAAELDILSGGRLRLGVGLGWNQVEYQALGATFADRETRFEEQIDVMRRLWTNKTVDIRSAGHTILGAGLTPLPVQRPIPIWIGATGPRGIRRCGRLADGWISLSDPGPALDQQLAILRDSAAAAGRDPSSIGVDARLDLSHRDLARASEAARQWKQAGATHLSAATLRSGFTTVDEHLEVLRDAFPLLHGTDV